jgi:hypothetical protein
MAKNLQKKILVVFKERCGGGEIPSGALERGWYA